MMDKLEILLREYAEVRRLLIEQPPAPLERLTDNQRQIALHDNAPIKPDPAMWSAEEYAIKLADYERRGHHRLSPLGDYVYTGSRSQDSQDLPLAYMSREEIRQQPEYGILRRMVEAQSCES
jgi:hypothetical protein